MPHPVPTTQQGIPVPPPTGEPRAHEDSALAKSLKVLVGALLTYTVVTLTVLLVDIHRRSFELGNGVAIDFEQVIPHGTAGFLLYTPALLLLVITALIFIAWPDSTCRCSGCLFSVTGPALRSVPAGIRQPGARVDQPRTEIPGGKAHPSPRLRRVA